MIQVWRSSQEVVHTKLEVKREIWNLYLIPSNIRIVSERACPRSFQVNEGITSDLDEFSSSEGGILVATTSTVAPIYLVAVIT